MGLTRLGVHEHSVATHLYVAYRPPPPQGNPAFQGEVLDMCYDAMVAGRPKVQQSALWCAQHLVLNATGLVDACEDA